MIRAEVHSDDHRLFVNFDATEWFSTAMSYEIIDLADTDWGGDYQADDVALNIELRETKEFFDRPDRVGGFEVNVCEADAARWLYKNRFDVYTQIWGRDESILDQDKDSTPLYTKLFGV